MDLKWRRHLTADCTEEEITQGWHPDQNLIPLLAKVTGPMSAKLAYARCLYRWYCRRKLSDPEPSLDDDGVTFKFTPAPLLGCSLEAYREAVFIAQWLIINGDGSREPCGPQARGLLKSAIWTAGDLLDQGTRFLLTFIKGHHGLNIKY